MENDFMSLLDYTKPIPPSFLKAEASSKAPNSKIGHLGLLAQLCSSYCKEFDAIINKDKCCATTFQGKHEAPATSRKRVYSENKSDSNEGEGDDLEQLESAQRLKRKKQKLKKLKKKLKKQRAKNLAAAEMTTRDDDTFTNLDDPDEVNLNNEESNSKRFKSMNETFQSENSSGSRKAGTRSQFDILSSSEMISQYGRRRPIHIQPMPVSGSSHQATQLRSSGSEFNCSWRLQPNNDPCACRFNSNEELNEHVKCHMTSALFNNLDYYYRMKCLVEQTNSDPSRGHNL
jgi:hypothetical protein